MRAHPKAIRLMLGLLFSGLLVTAVLSLLDTEEVWSRLLGAQGNWLLVSFILSFVVLVVRGARFAALATLAPFSHVIASIAVQNFLLRITPLRLGELSLPYFLRRSAGEPLSESMISLLLVRLVELWLLLVLAGLASVLWFGIEDQQQMMIMALVGASLVSLLLFTLRYWLRWGWLLLHWTAHLTGAARNRLISQTLEAMREAANLGMHLSLRALTALVIYTFVIVALQFVLFWCVLRAFGLDLEAAQVIVGASLAQVASALPVATVGSIGTLEIGWTVGFISVGVSMSDAALTGIATQILTLFFSGVFALPAWFFHQSLVKRVGEKFSSGAT